MNLHLIHLLTGHAWGPWMPMVTATRTAGRNLLGRLCACGAMEWVR